MDYYLMLTQGMRIHVKLFSFLVGFDGTVFEGRGWGVVGAHAKGFNNESLGIAFMGNFNNDTPSSEAVLSVRQLLHSGVSQGFLCPDFALMGHRDLSATECPGANLYAALPKLKLHTHAHHTHTDPRKTS
uniref:Peptidoglycan recognition protein 5 n=1 Tax=Takifugu rubripes TaxID=31033 RepID=A0A674MQB6_TAKRU